MSLQLAAQNLASRGRGPDTTLVHMAPQEVAGLQALAKAHGGSLTINPDTGLPEAGFLSSILPMVAGAALAATGIGAPLAAGIVGAGYGVATGSLQKGLMAGLGAYGGAGLAGGLMGAGAAGAAETGLTAAGGVLGTNPMVVQPMTFGAETLGAEALGTEALGTGLTSTGGVMGTNPMVAQPMTFGTDTVAQASPITADLAVKNAVPTVTKAPTFMENISQMGRGIQNLGTEAGREAFMGQAASKGVEATGVGGMKGLMQYGLAGLAPVAMDMLTPKQRAEEEKRKAYEYTYSPGRVDDPQQGYTGAFTGERTYFNPVYTRTAAGGGLMDIGPVEAMSRSNQPQMTPAYARGGSSDMAVNPYTGAEAFAEGGDTKAVKPVEQDPYYTMSGQSGDAFKYLMGQMPATPRAAAPAVIQPTSVAGGVMQALAGPTASDATVRPYTFDPVTGAFTAMPVVRPIAPAFGVGFGTGFGGDYSGGYGGDSGGASSSGATDGGGGMSNSGEGGGGPGEGGWARGGIASLAQGGQSHMGDYSDGGRFLRNAEGGTTSDGVSDSIPASIGGKRPARLAENEFVIPARIVSELGNGSSEAGARRLYAMMDRIQKARAKTVGKGKVAVDTKAEKMLPA